MNDCPPFFKNTYSGQSILTVSIMFLFDYDYRSILFYGLFTTANNEWLETFNVDFQKVNWRQFRHIIEPFNLYFRSSIRHMRTKSE